MFVDHSAPMDEYYQVLPGTVIYREVPRAVSEKWGNTGEISDLTPVLSQNLQIS